MYARAHKHTCTHRHKFRDRRGRDKLTMSVLNPSHLFRFLVVIFSIAVVHFEAFRHLIFVSVMPEIFPKMTGLLIVKIIDFFVALGPLLSARYKRELDVEHRGLG